jgi:hypothetical protein
MDENVGDRDPDLLEILQGLRKTTYSIADLAANGPVRVTKLYAEISAGRLRADWCGSRRFVTAMSYARWLLLLRREGAARDAVDANRKHRRIKKAI